jgi:hypothetical protein
MMEKTGRESDKFMLRMPDGVRDRIKASAEDNKRSMNAEINVALSMYLGIIDEQETDFSDPRNFSLGGLPKEEQLRRIVEGSAKMMYRELKIALDRPDADITDLPAPDSFPPYGNEE